MEQRLQPRWSLGQDVTFRGALAGIILPAFFTRSVRLYSTILWTNKFVYCVFIEIVEVCFEKKGTGMLQKLTKREANILIS